MQNKIKTKNYKNFSQKSFNPNEKEESELSFLQRSQKKNKHLYKSRSRSRSKQKNQDQDKQIQKEQPCWQTSGILAKFSNSFQGVVLKFSESQDSHLPEEKWNIYVFKDDQLIEKIPLRKKTFFLFGRDQKVADILAEHPSISQQHCVIQFRQILSQNQDLTIDYQIKPYLMDLQSTNGTQINEQQIESSKYYELFQKDIIKLGYSQRQYILMLQK